MQNGACAKCDMKLGDTTLDVHLRWHCLVEPIICQSCSIHVVRSEWLQHILHHHKDAVFKVCKECKGFVVDEKTHNCEWICYYCMAYKTTNAILASEHLLQCPNFTTSCPIVGCGFVLLRSNLSAHVMNHITHATATAATANHALFKPDRFDAKRERKRSSKRSSSHSRTRSHSRGRSHSKSASASMMSALHPLTDFKKWPTVVKYFNDKGKWERIRSVVQLSSNEFQITIRSAKDPIKISRFSDRIKT